MATLTCVEDLRQLYLRRVPRMFVDYAENGSYQEETIKANRRDFEAIKFEQRILVDVAQRSTATTLLGQPVSLPLAIAPVGLLGMQHADGEIHAARAAQRHGHSVLPLHHVGRVDRGRRGGDRQAVLVPALCDARPRVHHQADRARRRRELLRRWS